MTNQKNSKLNRIIFKKFDEEYTFEIEHTKNNNYIETNLNKNNIIDELKTSLFVTDYSNIEKIIFDENFSKKEQKEIKEIVDHNIDLSKEANAFVEDCQTTIYLMEEIEKYEQINKIVSSLYLNKTK